MHSLYDSFVVIAIIGEQCVDGTSVGVFYLTTRQYVITVNVYVCVRAFVRACACVRVSVNCSFLMLSCAKPKLVSVLVIVGIG